MNPCVLCNTNRRICPHRFGSWAASYMAFDPGDTTTLRNRYKDTMNPCGEIPLGESHIYFPPGSHPGDIEITITPRQDDAPMSYVVYRETRLSLRPLLSSVRYL